MKTLCVFGMKVYAPVCPVCKTDEHIEVKQQGEGWTYTCEHCNRDLTYDEIMNEKV